MVWRGLAARALPEVASSAHPLLSSLLLSVLLCMHTLLLKGVVPICTRMSHSEQVAYCQNPGA